MGGGEDISVRYGAFLAAHGGAYPSMLLLYDSRTAGWNWMCIVLPISWSIAEQGYLL